MEAFLSSPSSLSENIEADHENRNYCRLPVFSTSSLRSEIPERLLQDDASTLSPSSSDQNELEGHNSSQESDHTPQEEPTLQQDPSRQEQTTFPRHQDTQDQQEDVSESSTALFQEWNHPETVQDARQPLPKPHSWREKLGTFSIVVLVAGSVLLCAAVGTLAFIWFGSPAIPAWKEITARNWLSKAISICIGVIQQVMNLQLGIVTAALASLALESRDVVIGDVASVSAMRATATSTGAFVMAWQYLSGGSYRSAGKPRNIFIILSATTLWCLSQFLLLIILTDVSLRSTAGLASSTSLSYSLHCNKTGCELSDTHYKTPSTGTWNRKISKYASFAEYSEPPCEADGVSDTGVTLRAFLPFGTAQERENLEAYKGNSTVLDARVTCQVPQIKNATVDPHFKFRGSLAATRNTPRLANLSLLYQGVDSIFTADMGLHPDGSRDFECAIALYPADPRPQWRTSLCQLWNNDPSNINGSFGGLYSEFQNSSMVSGDDFLGSTYLVLNYTLVDIQDFDLVQSTSHQGALGVAETSQERGEWLDLIYLNGSVIISASICYAAFDFADIEVNISSQSNRTESRLEPVFDRDTSTYTFQELRHAMGQDRSLPLDRRGVLDLEKRPWQIAPDAKRSQMRAYAQSYPRISADLGFTEMAFARTGDPINSWSDPWSSFPTGILASIAYCGLEYDPCVLPEEMHVSTFLWYRLLPHQRAVPHVDQRSLGRVQIVRCDIGLYGQIVPCPTLFL